MNRESLDVDSTQTMRAIDPSELYDSQQPKWYAVQLVLSDRPVNLDMMPRLEVFAAHRLYTLTAKQPNGTWYALRLGFFPDEASAEVICGYLRTFFASPSIVRVSMAEQTRFVQPAARRAPAPKPASIRTPSSSPSPSTSPSPSPAAAAAPAKLAPKPTAAKAPAKDQTSTRRTKTLAEQLLEEAREVQRARSGKKPAAEQSGSWLARLFGGAKPRPRSV
jgi:hypothetical protein